MQLKIEDDLLLESVIDYRIRDDAQKGFLELIVRPECNQRCEYCYLVQHGDKSYPKETRADNKTITNNIRMLMEYFTEKEYCLRELDLFAGDMFYDDLFFDIMDPIYDYFSHMTENQKDFMAQYENDRFHPAIVIPCNMSFCSDDEKIRKVEELYEKFQKIHVRIYFSYSTDGKYSTHIREKRDVEDEFFDKVFALCNKYNWGVHPMLSYENIDEAIDNYNWWKKILIRYPHISETPYPFLLEVRNAGWTERKIEKYGEFIRYMLNDIFHNYCNSDPARFFDNELRQIDKNDINNRYSCANNVTKILLFGKQNNGATCALNNFSLVVNCSDLRIVPCHRLAYPMFSGGYFQVENDKVVGVKANENINGYLNITNVDDIHKPGCVTCKYNKFCIRGCLGSQFETWGEVYFPIPDVCKLLKYKYDILIDFYHNAGIFHSLFNEEPQYALNSEWQKILLDFGYEEYRQYTF